jgi:hypothetical protein
MSTKSKRPANSPPEKIPTSKKTTMNVQIRKPQTSGSQSAPALTPAQDPTKGSLFKFEVVGINNKPFYGTLAEVEIIHIWEKILGRSQDEIFAMSYNRSLTRNFKVTFKLKSSAEPSDLYPEPTFEFHRLRTDAVDAEKDFDVITCKILGYLSAKPAEIGQYTRVTVKTNDFAIEPLQILPWLAKFGSVSSNFDYEKNSVGLRSDVFETELLLRKHIPEHLPIGGRKVLVHYPGIPKTCNNCYRVGHLKRNCRSTKRDWLERVAELRASGDFEDEMFEGWISILEQRK